MIMNFDLNLLANINFKSVVRLSVSWMKKMYRMYITNSNIKVV